jgi:hypothetical protein
MTRGKKNLPEQAPMDDPDDPSNLRLSQSEADAEGGEKPLFILVEKPEAYEFFRVHPDPAFPAGPCSSHHRAGGSEKSHLYR